MLSKQNISLGLAVVAIVIAAFASFGSSPSFGNKTASFWDALSYKVSGTEIISSSRGASFTTGAFSSTVSTGLLTTGGGVTATTSTGAGTLTAAQLFGGNVLEHTNAGVTTITFPASTTITAYIATAGQCQQVFYKNKGTATDTFVGGTGTLLKVASSTSETAAGAKTVLTAGTAVFTMCRTSNTDVEVHMDPAI